MQLTPPNITTAVLAKGFAPRPKSLAGLRVGFLDGWGDGPGEKMYPVMWAIEKRLKADHKIASVLWLKKPSISSKVPKEILDPFLDQVDVVVNGEGL